MGVVEHGMEILFFNLKTYEEVKANLEETC